MQMSGTDKYFFTILHVCYILIKVLQRSKMASASLYQKKFLSEKWVWERDVMGSKCGLYYSLNLQLSDIK